MTLAVFHDFPGLENGLTKFHDFPGRVVTLCNGLTTWELERLAMHSVHSSQQLIKLHAKWRCCNQLHSHTAVCNMTTFYGALKQQKNNLTRATSVLKYYSSNLAFTVHVCRWKRTNPSCDISQEIFYSLIYIVILKSFVVLQQAKYLE